MKWLHNQNIVGIFAGYFGKCEMEPELTLCIYYHSLRANFPLFILQRDDLYIYNFENDGI